MRIRASDVIRLIHALQSGTKTREEVSLWANEILGYSGNREPIYESKNARECIRNAIEFLALYESKTAPSQYLYGQSDLEKVLKELESLQ